MNLGQNLKKLRKEHHFTQKEIAEKLDITQGTYALWEKKNSNPALDMIAKLGEIYKLPTDLILNDKKENSPFIELLNIYKKLDAEQQSNVLNFSKFLASQQVESRPKADNIIPLKTYRREELYTIEVADEQLSAGFGQALNDTQETYTVFTDVRPGRYDGAARIKGDSMHPEYPNFSIVTFVTTGFDRDGDIYVISEGGPGEEQLYCKQVFRDSESFRCHSLNTDPQYKDFYLDEETSRIVGPVVNCIEEISPELIEN
ncbi:XRE family transcriptional regulator [Lactococcus garvieae]|uniref:XRE family transcriptional regulator n=1 Tax=Lactococcus garvieae TaxID=1363 RepID=UPI0018D845B1|nr:S24 family peptidase [Lactococcus garvieae]QPS70560.1 helix-turn-helix transcriptional regulator [Lactococcus garvieae]